MRYAIGIDLGGTHINAASVSESGEILDRVTGETRDRAAPGTWVETIRGLRAQIESRRGEPTAGIGVAAPGLAAADGRSIASIPGRLAGLQGLDWASALGAAVPVRVLNDGHAALLGECWRGAAAGRRDVVLLTLGTGVGGAIVSDGRLLTGASGKAGHFGHMTLDPDGPPSIAGMPGSILGGGIARAGDALLDPLVKFLADVEWRPLGGVRVELAALAEMAGALGAAQRALAP